MAPHRIDGEYESPRGSMGSTQRAGCAQRQAFFIYTQALACTPPSKACRTRASGRVLGGANNSELALEVKAQLVVELELRGRAVQE